MTDCGAGLLLNVPLEYKVKSAAEDACPQLDTPPSLWQDDIWRFKRSLTSKDRHLQTNRIILIVLCWSFCTFCTLGEMGETNIWNVCQLFPKNWPDNLYLLPQHVDLPEPADFFLSIVMFFFVFFKAINDQSLCQIIFLIKVLYSEVSDGPPQWFADLLSQKKS